MHTPAPIHPAALREPLLYQLRAAILGAVRDPASPDLTLRQIGVLMHVEHQPLEACKVREIARALGVSRPAVSRAVDRLQQFMFTARVSGEDDRRDVYVRVTPQGRAWLRALAAPAVAAAAARQAAA